MEYLEQCLEFEWDQGNQNKNLKHGVQDQEAEEVFFDQRKRVLRDPLHSLNEARHILIGTTKLGRLLFVVFTIRGRKIRIISVRDINQKEKHLYGQRA